MDKKQEASVEKLRHAIEEYLAVSGALDTDAELDRLLWHTMGLFQSCPFYTAKGLAFTYTIKGNELFTTRKSKSITKSTVMIAFHKALKLGGVVSGPKKLGTFGASYLYSVFLGLKVIRQQDSSDHLTADKGR